MVAAATAASSGGRRLRWRPCSGRELAEVRDRLAEWDCAPGGAVRHLFALATMEAVGTEGLRIASDDRGWAAAVVHPGKLVVPMGDPATLLRAGTPSRRWRLLVSDADAADAVLETHRPPDVRIHHQRLMTVEHDRVPSEAEVADPGLRRARMADLSALAKLAVQLHVDDEFGPHPGRAGERGYAERLKAGIDRGTVMCVGPTGAPIGKIERSVSSVRWGVQLSGIVLSPRSRGQGLGTALVAAAIRDAVREGPKGRPITLHVRAANLRAIRAYQRCGFVDSEQWRLAVRA